MFSKTTATLVAIAFLGSASAALAQSADELWSNQVQDNPNAPVSTYRQTAPQPMARLIEGRNVGVRILPNNPTSRDTFEPNPSFGGY